MQLSGQDWTPVVVRPKSIRDAEKKDHERNKTAQSSKATVTANNMPAWKLEKQIDSDAGPVLNRVSDDDKKQIISLRTGAKLTRDQVAKALNLPRTTIDDIENGKALQNKQVTNKIINYLKKFQQM